MQAIGSTLDLGKFERFREFLDSLPADDPDRRCSCGICDGYGHIQTESGVRMCPSSRERTVASLLPEFEDWPVLSFTEIRQRENFQSTASFIEAELLARAVLEPNRDPYAVIELGGHGRSKTYSALQVCRICAYKKIPFVAARFPQVVSQYKRGIDGNPWLDSLYSSIRNSRFVFIDEYGRECLYGNQDHARIALNEIVGRCYRQRFMILTSNMKRDEFSNSISSDLVSRLYTRNGYGRIVEEPLGKAYDLRDQLQLI